MFTEIADESIPIQKKIKEVGYLMVYGRILIKELLLALVNLPPLVNIVIHSENAVKFQNSMSIFRTTVKAHQQRLSENI